MVKDGETEKHPAFGLVGFSRIQGNPGKLFGSNLENHGSYIVLRIHRAKLYHDLSRDWAMADIRSPIVEVNLSAAQFAELLTTMNIGEGVPCTLHRVMGEQQEEIPQDRKSEPELIADVFEQDCQDFVGKLRKAMDNARALLDSKETLKRKDRDRLVGMLEWIVREVAADQPFRLKQYQCAMEKTTTQAKAELEGFVTTAAINLGVERLREMGANNSPAFLPDRTYEVDNEGAALVPEVWKCRGCGERFEVGEIPATVCPYCCRECIEKVS